VDGEGIKSGLPVDYYQQDLDKIVSINLTYMIPAENSENFSRALQKIEDFRKKHSDMEHELKKRLLAIKKKNIRTFLKQLQ